MLSFISIQLEVGHGVYVWFDDVLSDVKCTLNSKIDLIFDDIASNILLNADNKCDGITSNCITDILPTLTLINNDGSKLKFNTGIVFHGHLRM